MTPPLTPPWTPTQTPHPQGPGNRWVPWLVALGVGLTLCALAWPVPIHPTSWVLGPSQNDFYGIAWGMHQVAAHLWRGEPPPVFFDEMAWPVGATLLVADLPEMVLLSPVTRLAGATAAFNLLQVAHHAACAGTATWCARTLGIRPSASVVAGLAFAFCPALVSCTFNQNPDVTAWYGIPLAAGLASTSRSWRRSLAAGVVAGLTGWCNAYGGLMAFAAVACLHPWRPLRRLAGSVVPMVSLGGAWALFTWWSIGAENAGIMKGPRRDMFHGIATLPGLVTPPFQVHVQQFWDQSLFCHGQYLGWSLLVFGTWGIVRGRHWRWGILALLGILASFGPLVVASRFHHIPGPWLLLEALPGLDRLLLNHRFTALAVLALGLGASAWAHGTRWRGPLLAVLVCYDLLGATGGWHLLRSQQPFDDGACALVRDLEPGPVVDFPPSHAELWLHASICHGHPVAEGINNPIPLKLQRALSHAGSRPLPVFQAFGYRYLVFHGQAPRADFGDFAEFAFIGQDCEVARNDQGVRVLDLALCRAP